MTPLFREAIASSNSETKFPTKTFDVGFTNDVGERRIALEWIRLATLKCPFSVLVGDRATERTEFVNSNVIATTIGLNIEDDNASRQ